MHRYNYKKLDCILYTTYGIINLISSDLYAEKVFSIRNYKS